MLVAGSCASAGSNIGSLMEETGVLLCTAHSTKEAVEMIQKDLEAGEAPSIVLLDWELVESEGIQAAKRHLTMQMGWIRPLRWNIQEY